MKGRRVLVLAFAIMAVLVGFVLIGGELYHWLRKEHTLTPWPFVAGAAFILVGALAIQLGDLLAALKALVDILPALLAAIPVRFGGRRATDPPAPPGVAVPPEGLPPAAVVPPASPPAPPHGEGG